MTSSNNNNNNNFNINSTTTSPSSKNTNKNKSKWNVARNALHAVNAFSGSFAGNPSFARKSSVVNNKSFFGGSHNLNQSIASPLTSTSNHPFFEQNENSNNNNDHQQQQQDPQDAFQGQFLTSMNAVLQASAATAAASGRNVFEDLQHDADIVTDCFADGAGIQEEDDEEDVGGIRSTKTGKKQKQKTSLSRQSGSSGDGCRNSNKYHAQNNNDDDSSSTASDESSDDDDDFQTSAERFQGQRKIGRGASDVSQDGSVGRSSHQSSLQHLARAGSKSNLRQNQQPLEQDPTSGAMFTGMDFMRTASYQNMTRHRNQNHQYQLDPHALSARNNENDDEENDDDQNNKQDEESIQNVHHESSIRKGKAMRKANNNNEPFASDDFEQEMSTTKNFARENNNDDNNLTAEERRRAKFQNTEKDKFEGYIRKAERERKDHFWVVSDSLDEGVLMKMFENVNEMCDYFRLSERRKYVRAINKKHYHQNGHVPTKEDDDTESSSSSSSSDDDDENSSKNEEIIISVSNADDNNNNNNDDLDTSKDIKIDPRQQRKQEKQEQKRLRKQQKQLEKEEREYEEQLKQLNTFVWIDIQTSNVVSMLKLMQLFPFLRRETFKEAAIGEEPTQVFQHNALFDYYYCQLSCPGHRISERKRKQQIEKAKKLAAANKARNHHHQQNGAEEGGEAESPSSPHSPSSFKASPLTENNNNASPKSVNSTQAPASPTSPQQQQQSNSSTSFLGGLLTKSQQDEVNRQTNEVKIENCCGPQIARCCKSNRTKVSLIVASSLVITVHVEPFRGLGSFLKQVHNQVARPRENIQQMLYSMTEEYIQKYYEQQQAQQQQAQQQNEDVDNNGNNNNNNTITTNRDDPDEEGVAFSSPLSESKRSTTSRRGSMMLIQHTTSSNNTKNSGTFLEASSSSFSNNNNKSSSRRNSFVGRNSRSGSVVIAQHHQQEAQQQNGMTQQNSVVEWGTVNQHGSLSAPIMNLSMAEARNQEAASGGSNSGDSPSRRGTLFQYNSQKAIPSSSTSTLAASSPNNNNNSNTNFSSSLNVPSHPNFGEDNNNNSNNNNTATTPSNVISTRRGSTMTALPSIPSQERLSSTSALTTQQQQQHVTSSNSFTQKLHQKLQQQSHQNQNQNKNIVHVPDIMGHHRGFRKAHRMVDAAFDDDDLHHASERHFADMGAAKNGGGGGGGNLPNPDTSPNFFNQASTATFHPDSVAQYAAAAMSRRQSTFDGSTLTQQQQNSKSDKNNNNAPSSSSPLASSPLSPLGLFGHTIPNLPRMTSGWILASLIQLVVENSIPDLTGASDAVSEVEEKIFRTSVEIDDTTQVANVENMKLFQELVSRIGQVRRLTGELYTDFIQKSVLLQTILAPRYAAHQTLWGKMYSRALLRQATVNLGRSLEQLDSIREHLTQCSTNVQGKISIAQMEASIRMDSQSRRLSQVATVCLPLGLVVSLFSMNVPIPWSLKRGYSSTLPFDVMMIVIAVWFVLSFVYIYRKSFASLFC